MKKRITLNQSLPAGCTATADPEDVNTFDVAYQDDTHGNGYPAGKIQAHLGGWLAIGPEEDDGTMAYMGIYTAAFWAAQVLVDAWLLGRGP